MVMMTGASDLLMHADNLSWIESMKKWRNEAQNKAESVAGDDRSPAWTWIGCLYTDGGNVCIPADNLMTILREGGKRCLTGKGKQTFKAQTQSGLIVDRVAWPLLVNGKTIPVEPFNWLHREQVKDFAQYEAEAVRQGFTLYVKRAVVNGSKHIRVRPRFSNWSASGTVTVFDEQITQDVLQTILTQAGTYCGVGDWRPSSPKSPGPFGTFTVTVKEAK